MTDPLTRPILLPETRAWRVYTGGRLLEAFRDRDDPKDSHYPEDWLGSCVEAKNPEPVPGEGLTRVTGPDGEEVLLRDLVEAHAGDALGPDHVQAFGPNPAVLVKLLDSAVRLPIQCHPSREYARQHFGRDYGKTESWIVLDTRVIDGQEPYVLLGFNPTASREKWQQAVRDVDTPALESMLVRHPVKPGDVYHVAPGVPHAIGPGVFMVEAQEPTDLTISAENRCADFVMKEEQRFAGASAEVALGAFNYDWIPAGESDQATAERPRVIHYAADGYSELLIGPAQTPCYRAWRSVCYGEIPCIRSRSMQIVIAVGGEGVLAGIDWEFPLKEGQAVLVPYSAGVLYLRAKMVLDTITCAPAYVEA